MTPGRCFCGNPCEKEWETTGGIYCSRDCAINDALRALTARQPALGDAGIQESALGHYTHYRRVRRNQVAQKDAPKEISCTTPSPRVVRSLSSSSSLSPSRDKPLPALPIPPPRLDSGSSFPKQPAPQGTIEGSPKRHIPHNRNSSLSSFADSSRFTSNFFSTRATSMASSARESCLSTNPSVKNKLRGRPGLGELVEEDEGIGQNGPRSFRRSGYVGDQGFSVRAPVAHAKEQSQEPSFNALLQSETHEDAASDDDVDSQFDPFELDQLLVRTPIPPAPVSRTFLIASHPYPPPTTISPLKVVRAKPRMDSLTNVPTIHGSRSPVIALAPPVQILNSSTSMSRQHQSSTHVPDMCSNLHPPYLTKHLAPPSPSPAKFPTTPSLSPIVASPALSKTTPTNQSPADEPLNSGPVQLFPSFTLHRRREPTTVPRKVNYSPQNQEPSTITHLTLPHFLSPSLRSCGDPITPLDASEEVAGYFDRNPVIGPGKPLYLEPMVGSADGIGLGFALKVESKVKMSGSEVRSKENECMPDRVVVSVPDESGREWKRDGTISGGPSQLDELLDYYLTLGFG